MGSTFVAAGTTTAGLDLRVQAIIFLSLGLGSALYIITRLLWVGWRIMAIRAADVRSNTKAPEVAAEKSSVVRKAKSATVGKSLAGTGRVSKAAAWLLPRAERDDWRHDLSESTYYAGEYDFKVFATLLTHVVAYPWVVVTYWLRALRMSNVVAQPLDADLRQLVRKLVSAAVVQLAGVKALFKRLVQEWKIALIMAVLAAVMIEPVWHIVTFALHHYGYVWLWEKYFPLH
ncbi:hypothetical protein [Streptomyces parvulus]|uniref:hypothetical protein n=1 Tax=Streptomyces parvulus TaxID=146923 RepID=UPI0033D09E1E